MVMGEPLLAGSVQLTVSEPFWLVLAETPVGVFGTSGAITELEAIDGFDVPTPLVAVTVKLYQLRRVRPVIVVEVTPGPDRLV